MTPSPVDRMQVGRDTSSARLPSAMGEISPEKRSTQGGASPGGDGTRWVEVRNVKQISSLNEVYHEGDLLKYHVKGGLLRDALGKNWSLRRFTLKNGVLSNMKSSLDLAKVSLLIEEPDK